jgi:hypothetical protein
LLMQDNATYPKFPGIKPANIHNWNVVPSWTYVESHMQMGFIKCHWDQANVHAVILNKNHWTIYHVTFEIHMQMDTLPWISVPLRSRFCTSITNS